MKLDSNPFFLIQRVCTPGDAGPCGALSDACFMQHSNGPNFVHDPLHCAQVNKILLQPTSGLSLTVRISWTDCTINFSHARFVNSVDEKVSGAVCG